MSVSFTLDGLTVFADEGETLLDVARRENVEIPHLCWTDGLAPAGNCRACVVEVGGERVLSASCCRHPFEGMQVRCSAWHSRPIQSDS
jgi:formate dehydrogenase major subunit